MSTDLIYDVLRRHDPGHILLEAAWADAATGLLDIARSAIFLPASRAESGINLGRVSPLSVPILLEIGREPVRRRARGTAARSGARADPRSDGADLTSWTMGHHGTEAGALSSRGIRRPASLDLRQGFRAHMSGALYWPAEDALIVADLHSKRARLCRARANAAAL